MGREARRVPPTWEHPKDYQGHYKPLLGSSYEKDLAEWLEGREKWAAGLCSDFSGGWEPKTSDCKWEEWSGDAPQFSDYMPEWPEKERTHWQAYEDTSAGTPLSPIFATVEELARYCADHKVSAFGYEPADYDWWIGVLRDERFSGLIIRTPL